MKIHPKLTAHKARVPCEIACLSFGFPSGLGAGNMVRLWWSFEIVRAHKKILLEFETKRDTVRLTRVALPTPIGFQQNCVKIHLWLPESFSCPWPSETMNFPRSLPTKRKKCYARTYGRHWLCKGLHGIVPKSFSVSPVFCELFCKLFESLYSFQQAQHTISCTRLPNSVPNAFFVRNVRSLVDS